MAKAWDCKSLIPSSNLGVASKRICIKFFSFALLACLFFVSCSNTAKGVVEDTKKAGEWTKEKIHDGASPVKEKTE